MTVSRLAKLRLQMNSWLTLWNNKSLEAPVECFNDVVVSYYKFHTSRQSTELLRSDRYFLSVAHHMIWFSPIETFYACEENAYWKDSFTSVLKSHRGLDGNLWKRMWRWICRKKEISQVFRLTFENIRFFDLTYHQSELINIFIETIEFCD